MQKLKTEPFLAYVRCDLDGVDQVYLICRSYIPFQSPKNPSSDFASYRSPVGRIASMEIGAELSVPMGTLKVLERNVFTPISRPDWDAIRNQFALKTGVHAVSSLRTFITDLGTPDTDELGLIEIVREAEGRIAEGLAVRADFQAGMRKEILDTFALRDQPILDHIQDEIFRLPIQSRLSILLPMYPESCWLRPNLLGPRSLF